MADASGSKNDAHSSGEYSGIVEQAATGGVGIKKDTIPNIISSGTAAQDKRKANREEKRKREEEEERKKREEEEERKKREEGEKS
jgi:hypothetical protein